MNSKDPRIKNIERNGIIVEDSLSYGSYLRKLRIKRGLTIKELAEQIGISGQYLSEMERGGRKCLNDEKTAAITDALKLTECEAIRLAFLSEKIKNRVAIPVDVRAYIEENPYIISEIEKVMFFGGVITAAKL